MIIKSLSRTAATGQLFKYLFRYMLQKEKQSKIPKELMPLLEKAKLFKTAKAFEKSLSKKELLLYQHAPTDFFKTAKQFMPVTATPEQFILRHNVRSRSIEGYTKEFAQNESFRIHKRKNSVQVYHTILSFSNQDKEHINEKVLKDMAKKYIELRGTNNLYVITSHHDKDHIHLHVAMSGTQINGKSSRISRQEFATIKTTIDAYQKLKYPELVHSLPRHGFKIQEASKETLQKIYRTERLSDKQSLLQLLETAFSKSRSREQFLIEMTQLGHIPYYRAGKLAGVQYNQRKFRLNRLGYDERKLSVLDATKNKEEKELQEMIAIRNRGKEMEKGLSFERERNVERQFGTEESSADNGNDGADGESDGGEE